MAGSILTLSKTQLRQTTLSVASSPNGLNTGVERNKKPVGKVDGQEKGEGLTCHICSIGLTPSHTSFHDVGEQREHFKSDWHRYNLHLHSCKRPFITREQFAQLLETGTISSISGSDSESEQEETNPKHAEDDCTGMLCLTLEDGSAFRIWKCLVMSRTVLETEEDLSRRVERLGTLERWAVILARGGHFAAALFAKRPFLDPKSKGPFYDVTHHKTIHRYVVRAAAGVRQSSKDTTGKYAKSAGATLRRYNEAHLKRDIVAALRSWEKELDACDLIFSSVSLTDSKVVFGGNPIDSKDHRIRRISFPTRRPTFSETKRVTHILTTIYQPPAPIHDPQQDGIEKPLTEEQQFPVPPGASTLDVSEVTPSNKDISEAVEPSADETTRVETQQRPGKKKSRRRPKGKDRRRRDAMESKATEKTDGSDHDQDRSPVDEVERAVAQVEQCVHQELQRNRRRRAQTSQNKPKPTAPDDIAERRELMRKAAEQRMAALQSTSRKQQLW